MSVFVRLATIRAHLRSKKKAEQHRYFKQKMVLKMNRKSLDEIVREYPPIANANVLKLDTDDHDFEVISGAKNLIKQNLPIVLFECDVFENTDYVRDCLETLKLLKSTGYQYFLLYDNFGNLMGKYSLVDTTAFRNLLFFQLTSDFYYDFYYFDILAMKDDHMLQFYKSEVEYFIGRMPKKPLRKTASAAIS